MFLQPPSKNHSLKRRSYASGAKDEEEEEFDDDDDLRRPAFESGVPEKYRVRTPQQARNREALSVLSPYNRTAVALGETGVLVFAGASSTGNRYTSWPRANTCRITPPGTTPPQLIQEPDDADIPEMAYAAKRHVKHLIKGTKPKQRYRQSVAQGEIKWHVDIGDLIVPKAPILEVGPVTFFQMPGYKGWTTPKLYLANKLIVGTNALPVVAGTPLYVAVYDPAQIPRFESFLPTADLIASLGGAPGSHLRIYRGKT